MDTDLSASDASFWGEDASDYSGYSVSSAGDVNGDGYDDLLVGAYGDEDGGSSAGQTYLILGGADVALAPFIDITNSNATVTYDVTTYALSGTNNQHVVGTMNWTNSLSGGSGTLAATSSWQITGISLSFGTNVVTVSGTNSLGWATDDAVTITRQPSPDTDGDGISDWDETNIHGTNPNDPDSDNDGANDGDELYAGTIPTNAASVFTITDVSTVSSNVVLTWSSASNRTYALWASSNLVSNVWSFIEGGITSTPPDNVHTVVPAAVESEFYLIEVE